MKNTLIYCVFFLSSFAYADSNLVTKVYPVQPGWEYLHRFYVASDDEDGSADDEFVRIDGQVKSKSNSQRVLEYFIQEGVPFPKGTHFSYDAVELKFIIHNTEKSHRRIEELFSRVNPEPIQVRLAGNFIAFPKKEVEKIARKNGAASIRQEDILALWKSGKGKVLGGAEVITRTGLNAILERVSEVIYPTQFQLKPGIETNGIEVIPQGFETREIGTILNVTPTVGPDGKHIEITLSPELCTQIKWMDYGFKGPTGKIKMEQPVFASRNVTTSIILVDGSTIVMGGIDSEMPDLMIFLFVTATTMNAEGRDQSAVEHGIKVGKKEAAALRKKILNQVEALLRKPAPSENQLEVQTHPILGLFLKELSSLKTETDLKMRLGEFGVLIPEEGYARYDRKDQTFTLKSTPENLDRLCRVLLRYGMNVTPNQVEVDMSLVSFTEAELEKSGRESVSGSPRPAAIQTLWQNGKGTLLSYGKVVARTGLNVILESVTEILYPSEFKAQETSEEEAKRLPAVPHAFEFRKTGTILNLTPTVGPDGETIELTISPEYVTGPDWKDYGSDSNRPQKLPVFDSWNTSTSIVLKDGATLVMRGKGLEAEGRNVYMFITANVLGPDGKRLR